MTKLNWIYDGNEKYIAFSSFEDGQQLKWVVTSANNGTFHLHDSDVIVDHEPFRSIDDAYHFCEHFHETHEIHNIFNVNFDYDGDFHGALNIHSNHHDNDPFDHDHGNFDDQDLDHHFGPF